MEWLKQLFATKTVDERLYKFQPEINNINYQLLVSKMMQIFFNYNKIQYVVILCIDSEERNGKIKYNTHKLVHTLPVESKKTYDTIETIFDLLANLHHICNMTQVNVTLYDVHRHPLSKYSSVDDNFGRYRIRNISRLQETFHEETRNIQIINARIINLKPLNPQKKCETLCGQTSHQTKHDANASSSIPNLELRKGILINTIFRDTYKTHLQKFINFMPTNFTKLTMNITILGNVYSLELSLADHMMPIDNTLSSKLDDIIDNILTSVSGNEIEIILKNVFGSTEVVYKKTFDGLVRQTTY